MRGAIRPDERALGLHLIRFQEVAEEACADLFPHYLCDYLYSLSEAFTPAARWWGPLKRRAICCWIRFTGAQYFHKHIILKVLFVNQCSLSTVYEFL
uniref:arginine--tRNA ligase n=1 Tax=Arundo donax TaxID=35708 RepID=A0A0A9E6Q7_ARUDO